MKLLSIGAGKEQIYSIKKAIEKGHYVIAIDGNKESEGFKLANEYSVVDISKENEVIEFAKKNNIEGVLQVPIGRFLSTIGAVNDSLNLKGISKGAALNCVNKTKTNEILFHNNIGCAGQITLKTFDNMELINKINDFGLPCVIKPKFGSGSSGVRIINNKAEVEKMVAEHLEENLTGEVIIEELLEGIEYGVDFVVIDNSGYLVLVREKELTDIPFRQEVAFIGPANLEDIIYDKVFNIMDKATKALGINNTLVHADIMIKDNEVKIIEISGRPSGLLLSSKIVPLSTGLDYLGLGVDIVTSNISKDLNLTNLEKNCVGISFFNLNEGKVVDITDISEMLKGNVIEYINNININDELTIIKKGKDLIDRGHVIVKGKTVDEVKLLFKNILQNIKIENV